MIATQDSKVGDHRSIEQRKVGLSNRKLLKMRLKMGIALALNVQSEWLRCVNALEFNFRAGLNTVEMLKTDRIRRQERKMHLVARFAIFRHQKTLKMFSDLLGNIWLNSYLRFRGNCTDIGEFHSALKILKEWLEQNGWLCFSVCISSNQQLTEVEVGQSETCGKSSENS